MVKFYSALKSGLLFTSLFLGANVIYAQTSVCGNVVESFESTGGSTGGFTGSFSLNDAANNLQRTNVLASSTYSVATPTYQITPGATSLGYGFTLGGTVPVSSYRVQIQYRSTITGAVETVDVRQGSNNNGSLEFNLSYSGGQAVVCESISTTNLPGFPTTNGQYRLIFYFDPSTGSGTAATETITFDEYRTNGTFSQIALPVTFMRFEAKGFGSSVLLSWQVAGEQNVARYEVERSEDGRSFRPIGQIQSHGKDTYTFSDNAPLKTAYYRIKNVDNDGGFKYSGIARMVGGKSAIVLRAFPQPVTSGLTLQHPTVEGKTVVSLTTAEGRVVKSVQPATGSMQTTVDMSSLAKGLYFVRIQEENGQTQTLK
ncbi:MAG: T9SS type A sorting domain-containing protein, partial [Bacteroidota bacterium]|nr:T9SS type A sorting domain-containing protein [Bacteroidota bacterium]